MTFEIRRLEPSDTNVVCEIIGSHRKLMRETKSEEFAPLMVSHYRKILQRNEHSLYGAWKDDCLYSFIGATFWPLRPAWNIHSLHVNPKIGLRHWNVKENGLKAALDHLFDRAEKAGLYQYYSCQSLSMYRLYQKFWARMYPEIYARYEFFNEAIIPAGERAQYEYHNLLMGSRLFSEPAVIRTGLLRDEYRPQVQSK